MTTTRKEDKLRPYRVDYFDVNEMKDVDLALVRSEVIRAVTAEEAIYGLLGKPDSWATETNPRPLVVIRAHRFYKKLNAQKQTFEAIEDLFPANQAVEVMDVIENYRAKQKQTNDLGNTPAAQAQMDTLAAQHDAMANEGGHITRFSDSSLYDEVCTKCGATDASGKLDQPCTAVAPDHALPDPAFGVEKATFYKNSSGTQIQVTPPTTGPDSPATKAVVADLNGMIAHDAHEQAMDTFVPTDVPDGKRFPTNAPMTLDPVPTKEHDLLNPVVADCPQCVAAPFTQSKSESSECYCSFTLPLSPEEYEKHLVEVHHQTLIEPDQAVGSEGRPSLTPNDDADNRGISAWVIFLPAAVAVAAALYLYFIHH